MKKKRTRTVKMKASKEIVRGLAGLRDALAGGSLMPDRFTMRTVELVLEPRDWTPAEVKALREQLRASQSVFARLIGTSTKAVQAWEQGNPMSPMARRLLECIQKNPAPWEEMLQSATVVVPAAR
jgi:putative transcriptional regulator